MVIGLENTDVNLEFNEDEELKEDTNEEGSEGTPEGSEEESSLKEGEEDTLNTDLLDDEESLEYEEGEGDDDPDPAKIFAEFLKSNKVLPEDIEVNSIEDIPKLLVSERDKSKREFIESLPEDIRTLSEAYLRGEDHRNYLGEVNSLSDYSTIKDDQLEKDENLSKKIIKDYKKELGMSDSEIESDIEMYVDAGVISDRAKMYKGKLIESSKNKIEAKKKREEDARTEFQKRQEEFTRNIDGYLKESDDLFGNVIGDDDRKEIKKTIFDVDESNTSKLQKLIESDPSVLVQISYLANIGALGKKADFSKIGLNKRRELAKELESAARHKNLGRGNTRKPHKSENDALQKAADSVKKALEGMKP